MYRAYIDGTSQSVGKRSALAFTITDCKDNIEYQHYELLDNKRNSAEIEMMAFNKMIEWLLENKINKTVVYTDSRHVYTNWKKSKLYTLNRSKFSLLSVRLLGNSINTSSNQNNLAYA
ncbi:reverse transcriptase-like protein [Brevibacillus sp. NRS-1366]|uniref:reverse transcriptase-like protein n=1 Tax=Brevibacillus sp. NRS-1366 TaxID=3233899 RepID=UPI003D214A63